MHRHNKYFSLVTQFNNIMRLSPYLQSIFSSLFRLGSYLYLRIVCYLSSSPQPSTYCPLFQAPNGWGRTVLPALYFASLISSWFATTPQPIVKRDFVKTEPESPDEKHVNPPPAAEVRSCFRSSYNSSHVLVPKSAMSINRFLDYHPALTSQCFTSHSYHSLCCQHAPVTRCCRIRHTSIFRPSH